MTDLKIIDELLCLIMVSKDWNPGELEQSYYITRTAMDRLRSAWKSGEMESLTVVLANYFESENHG